MRSQDADQRARKRVIAGWGADLAGSGWHRVVNGVGDYTIYFDKPFAARPAVQVNADSGGTALTARAYSSDRFSFRVICFNTTSGANADTGFHFRVEGLDSTG